MELVIALIVIIVLCKILGVSNEMLVLGGLILIELTVVLMMLMFSYFCVRMLFAKRREARFTRVDKAPKGNYKVAYYEVDGCEYPCIFPSELILNNKMYRKDCTCHVLMSRSGRRVFDKWTVLTCLIGFVFSAFAVLFAVSLTMPIVAGIPMI
ncbi:MAG: hypothetical protein MJ079_01805 [Ruminococcus sp.]|nr:hypothetical protein [Ruminococcus sp.]